MEVLLSSDELRSGFYPGHVELQFPGMNSLSFLVPFALAALVNRPAGQSISRLKLTVVLVSSLCIVILSGRRALQLVTILSPVLLLLFGSFQPSPQRAAMRRSLLWATAALLMLLGASVALVGPVYGITFQGLGERFSEGFDFSASNVSDSSTGRVEQYFALTEGWREHPFLGAGIGATAHGSQRSDTQPWAYELYYLVVLFSTGLLGFSAYVAGVVWIYFQGIRMIRYGGLWARFMLPLLSGMSGFLISAGTNPYLLKFDGIWVIFLPLAFINCWLLTQDKPAQHPFTRVWTPS